MELEKLREIIGEVLNIDPDILQTEQEANSRGTGNAEDHHRKNSGKKYGCHYRKNYLCG